MWDAVIEWRYLRNDRAHVKEQHEEEEQRILKEYSFQEDFDFYGIRWLTEGRWGQPNLQFEDPKDPDWPPTR